MKTTRSQFSCSVLGQSVLHLRRYEIVDEIGALSVSYVLLAEQCSHEAQCPHLARCPMRDISRSS